MSNGPLRLLAGAGAKEDPVYAEDVFATTLYDGNFASNTITNGLDLDGEGGLLWIKSRDNSGNKDSHALFDSERPLLGGGMTWLATNATSAASNTETPMYPPSVGGFSSTGFGLGQAEQGNENNVPYVAWAFRKQKKFFDIVTYTGDGSTDRAISHNLGSTPGFIIIKSYSNDTDWVTYHRGYTYPNWIRLNSTNTQSTTYGSVWSVGNPPTSTTFTLAGGSQGDSNYNGRTYVAYLFAHNDGDGEYGADSDEDIIKCGYYTGNGSTGKFINLGFEPQFLLIKSATSSHDWYLADIMRGMANTDHSTAHKYLYAQASNAEEGYASRWRTEPTGFHLTTGATAINGSGNTYVYVAIRRPHKPASEFAATDLYKTLTYSGDGSSSKALDFGFSPDLMIGRTRSSSGTLFISRITGIAKQLTSHNNNAENTNTDYVASFDQLGMTVNSNFIGLVDQLQHGFRRVNGFFDVVTYVGDGTTSHTVNHNLGVAPELIIVKDRTRQANWAVYHQNSPVSGSGKRYSIMLQADNAAGDSDYWPSTPTATQFVLGDSDQGINRSGDDYIAYLFATADGISKVGGYTGTGSDLNVDCGFSNGARFIFIKRTDSSGDWYVYDSVRGIVAGNDSYLFLNATDAEVTNTDYIDPLSSGFTVTSSAPAGLNASSGTYIFLAIA